MDLPNNADIVLSPAQNLQVITIHNCLCYLGVFVHVSETFNRFVNSARTRWGAIALPRPSSRYKGEGR